MLIANGLIYTENGNFKKGNIEITDGLISDIVLETNANKCDSIQASCSDVYDASDCFVIPGLIDLHFHGAMGCDLCDCSIDSLKTIAKYELSEGITTICPATMSLPLSKISDIIQTVVSYKNSPSANGANLAGINMEGPFINSDKRGAQNADHIISPSIEAFRELLTSSQGLIKLVDIAPEVSGATEFIKEFHDKVRISFAHSCADYETAYQAFASGICEVTHLGNAMNQISSRLPGPVIAALENENTMVELIADGVHLHPAMLRLYFRLFGSDRIILISDSMEACGLKDGQYKLGDQDVTVKGKLATLSVPDNTVIAGSVSNLMDCVRTAVKVAGIPFEQAIKCASANPAKVLNIYDTTGSLSVGKRADIVILNKNLSVRKVVNNSALKNPQIN